MNTRVLYNLFNLLIVSSVTVYSTFEHPNFLIEEKIELSPLLISCGLNDIIILSAPIITNNTRYCLYKPNGQIVRLDLQPRIHYRNVSTDEYNRIQIKYYKSNFRVITLLNKYRVFNINDGSSIFDPTDVFRDKVESMSGNDFIIGPLNMDDHGNWVLSAYYQRHDAKWIEVFQVISVEIVEIIPARPEKPILNVGDDLEISFAYPIVNLETCEITAPRSTFDRLYNRSDHAFDSCGFFIPNMTREDAGLWTIVGVGKIVYEATVFITIKDTFL